MDEVERIAKGLLRTKARLVAFREIAASGDGGLGFGTCSLRSRRELLDRGLIERVPRKTAAWSAVRERLTPLGLAVRDYLRGMEG